MNPIVFFCLIGAAVAVPYSGVPVAEGVESGVHQHGGEVAFVRAVGVPETYKAEAATPGYDHAYRNFYPDFTYNPYNVAGFRKSYPQFNPFYHKFGGFNYYPQYHGFQHGYKYPFDFAQTGHQFYPYPTGHQFYPYTTGHQYRYPYTPTF